MGRLDGRRMTVRLDLQSPGGLEHLLGLVPVIEGQAVRPSLDEPLDLVPFLERYLFRLPTVRTSLIIDALRCCCSYHLSLPDALPILNSTEIGYLSHTRRDGLDLGPKEE